MHFRSLHLAAKIIVLTLLCVSRAQVTFAQAIRPVEQSVASEESLAEIRDKSRALLLVMRSRAVDAQNTEQSLVAEAYRAAEAARTPRYIGTYNTLARKLNAYIRKYQSLSAVQHLAEADYIIYFNLLEYRRTINGIYPYGELYVIRNQRADNSLAPRIVWRTEKAMWAEDAVKRFIKALKKVRGEE